jgi:hypothetical protein
MTTMEQMMQAVLAAPEDRKEAALKALRGDPEPERSTVQGKGPLLMGMSAGAKFLGVSRATLWRVLRAGKIQKVELFPGSFRVRREDLESLAARVGQRVSSYIMPSRWVSPITWIRPTSCTSRVPAGK